jgi:probable rRNA maturation factor
VILNRQSQVRVDLRDAQRFTDRLRKALPLGGRVFNVCFVSDREIARLNKAHRGRNRPTDVLSFPWQGSRDGALSRPGREFQQFLGDIAISARTARQNARAGKHSTRTEIRWLILHGVLHLLGYDHATDSGEMTALELALRDRLDVEKRTRPLTRRRSSRERTASPAAASRRK